MRKVIGIGETILDLIFRDGQPVAAVPGGSIFNGIVSLARAGAEVVFIGGTANDRIGSNILEYMSDNNISADSVSVFPDGKSSLSLNYFDEKGFIESVYYKDYSKQRLDVSFPKVDENDIVVFGSYYALNPVLRGKMLEFLELARQQKAIVYYDPNFRSSHKGEAMKLASTIIENLEYASLVRGSREDFVNMYNLCDAEKIYKDKIRFYCPNFIYTDGTENILLRTKKIDKRYEVVSQKAVSAIGAGDNFNAGIIYGLLKYDVGYEELADLDEQTWDRIVTFGKEFSAEVCKSYYNSISEDFGKRHALS